MENEKQTQSAGIARRTFIQAGVAGLTALSFPQLGLRGAQYGIKGQQAPELEIEYWIDPDGKPTTFTLAQHEGKWVFLKCFQKWCPACHSHGLPALKKISDALRDNTHVAFAGIQTVFEGFGTNTIDKVRETQLEYELAVPMGHDPGNRNTHPSTMRSYRTGGTPWMILINPERQVVFNGFSIDADGAIEFLTEQTA